MAEQFGSPDSFAKFPVMADPEVTGVFSRARLLQQELDTLPDASQKYLDKIATELQQLWPHYQEKVWATGRIRSNVYDYEEEPYDSRREGQIMTLLREDGKPERREYFVADQEFMSHGFVIEKADEPLEVGGMPVGSHYIIRLLLTRRAAIRTAEDDEEIVSDPAVDPPEHSFEMACIADIDDVLLEFPNDSVEYSRLRSVEYFPETADLLGALDYDESLTTAEKLLALANVVIEPPDWIYKDGQNELYALNHYAYDVSQLECESLPFVMVVKPNTPLFDADEAEQAGIVDMLPEIGLLVSINGLHLATRVEVSQLGDEQYQAQPLPGSYEFRIAAYLRHRDSIDDSQEYEIRLRDITHLQNVRQTFYHETEDDEAKSIDTVDDDQA